MKKELRVAVLGNTISYGGAAKSMLLLIKALSQYGFKLYLFSTVCKSNELKEEFETYVEFVEIITLPELVSAQTQSYRDNTAPLKQSHKFTSHVLSFIQKLNKLNIDILHVNNSVFSLSYQLIKAHSNFKIISHIRELIHWNGVHDKQKFIIDNISKYSDAIICISDNEAEIFKGVKNLFIVPNPFDFEQITMNGFNLTELKGTLSIPEKNTVVGMMGGIRESKGGPQFVSAISHLYQKKLADNLSFIVLGGKPQQSSIIKYYLRKLLKRSTLSHDLYTFCIKEGIYDKIIFLNKRKDIFDIISIFDVAVRPSISGDPWGRDIIEYMALKKPVVAAGTSGYYVEDGRTGYLVPPKNPEKLAEKILELISNPTKRIAMGEAGYEKVKKMCDLQKFSSSVYSIYKTVLYNNTNGPMYTTI